MIFLNDEVYIFEFKIVIALIDVNFHLCIRFHLSKLFHKFIDSHKQIS